MPKSTRSPDQGIIIIEDETLRQGFTQIPNAVLRSPVLAPGAKLVYMGILSYAWQKGSCFPGQEQLAQDLGLSRRSVITHLHQLREIQLLVVHRRGQGKTNIYILPRITDQLSLDNERLPNGQGRSAKSALLEVSKFSLLEMQNLHIEEYPVEEYPEEKDTARDSTKKKNQVSKTSNLKGVLGGERSTTQASLPEPQKEVRGQDHQSSNPQLPADDLFANIPLASGGDPSSTIDLSSPHEETGATIPDTGSTHGLTSISELINRRSSATPRNGSQSLPEARRTAPKSTAVLEDLQAHAGRKKAQGQPRKPKEKFLSTEYLDRVITEFTLLELRDDEHLNSNLHQARNLLVASGMEEEPFVQYKVYPARSDTRAAANVNNRGAYFFTCLREQLGMREDEAGPIPPTRRSS